MVPAFHFVFFILGVFFIGRCCANEADRGEGHSTFAHSGHHQSHSLLSMNTSSPEFQKIAAETYQRVLPCLTSSWMLKDKKIDFQFPLDAEQHYEELKNKTACYHAQPVHEYAGYSGPWIENIFISKYIDRPLSFFRGFIPLYIQWIDNQILRGRYFDYIYAELGVLLRPNVIYLAISQGDVGLGKCEPFYARTMQHIEAWRLLSCTSRLPRMQQLSAVDFSSLFFSSPDCRPCACFVQGKLECATRIFLSSRLEVSDTSRFLWSKAGWLPFRIQTSIRMTLDSLVSARRRRANAISLSLSFSPLSLLMMHECWQATFANRPEAL